jgi:hypothetical protein
MGKDFGGKKPCKAKEDNPHIFDKHVTETCWQKKVANVVFFVNLQLTLTTVFLPVNNTWFAWIV